MSQTSLPTAAEPMIEVADLWKSYGALEVLKGIGLSLLWPEAIALATWGTVMLMLAVVRSRKRAA